MTTYADPPLAPAPALRMLRQLGVDTQYVLLGLPLGIVALSVCSTVFWLGVGLSVLWVGLPVLTVAMFVARGFATLERARIGPVLGHRMPPTVYKRSPDAGLLRRLVTPLTDGQYWLDLLYNMFRFIPSTTAFSFVVSWWAMALGGLSWGL